jgi:hypothetical protein
MENLRVFTRSWLVFIAGLVCIQIVIACAKMEIGTASVSIHGVNHTDEVISYRVVDPANADNHGGGELIDPYGAGGTTCCYELPKKWRPGIKIQVNLTRRPPKKGDGSLPKVQENHVIEVPPYADGKVGDLWVLRNADGTLGVVSSDYQPDHEKWPGKTKGWPVPSLAYQRERWDLYIEHEEGYVQLYKELLDELEKSPDRRAADTWSFKAENAAKYAEGDRSDRNGRAKADRDLLAQFSGPGDPKFRKWLKQYYEHSLQEAELKVQKLKDSRP